MAENKGSIYNRRSIRKFQNKALSKAQIAEIIQAGSAAPSAKNRQPWKCIVLANQCKEEFLACMEKGIAREEHSLAMLPRSKSGLADAKNTLRIMQEASILIAVINTNGKSPFTALDADERIAEICDSLSIGAFIENMLLQAEQMGIGTLWIANTCFAYEELVSYLNTDGQLIGAVAAGYAAEHPDKRPRKVLGEIAEFWI
ncbi:MAG: nitroreductase family protein [Lachnospiraceae bacterium]|nr:nitroreductase family protein [Lachnospiraceae bacterium]